jgi:hypothetical protein
MTKYTVIQELSAKCQAFHNCLSGDEWRIRHADDIKWLAKQFLPSGSGFDSGTEVSIEESGKDKVVLVTSFHHMNDNGMYDGWTSHSIIITPAFNGVNIRITGQDRNQIKDYIHEMIYFALQEICHEVDGERNEYGWYTVDGVWHKRT